MPVSCTCMHMYVSVLGKDLYIAFVCNYIIQWESKKVQIFNEHHKLYFSRGSQTEMTQPPAVVCRVAFMCVLTLFLDLMPLVRLLG